MLTESGVLLVHGILKIRNYIRETKDKKINFSTLLVHSSAFRLYLLSLVEYFATTVLYDIDPNKKKARDRFIVGSMLYFGASFVSQVFLCVIFWHLG